MTPTPASRRAQIAVLAAFLLAPAWLAAQPATPLRFSAGTNNASVNGQLKGPNEVARDYVVPGVPGATLDVSLSTPSKETFFSVLDAYGNTMYTNQGDLRSSWSVRLVDSVNYRIRVFLEPSAASQGRGAAYTLKVKLEPPR